MDKKKTLIIIAVLFLIYIFYSLFSGLDNQTKNNAKAMRDTEESLYETNFPKNEGNMNNTKIVPTSPTTAEVVTEPATEPTPPPEIRQDSYPTNQEEPIDHMRESNNYGHGQSNFLAVCYTQFVNCRARDIMFNYPSEQYPWSEEADMREVECITFSKYCLNENFQTITPEDELRILNQYQQNRSENIETNQNEYQQ